MENIHPNLDQFINAITQIPFNQLLGLRLNHLDAQQVSMQFDMKPDLIGNFLQGILHGGVISAVLDMAGGMVVMADVINRNTDKSMTEITALISKCSTVDLQINYLRPGRGETFTAKAQLIKSGKKLSFARMELYNQDATLIAAGSAVYMIH